MKTSLRCVGQAKLAVKSSPLVWDLLALAELVQQQAGEPSDDNPLIKRSVDHLRMVRPAGADAAGSSLSGGAPRRCDTRTLIRPSARPLCTSARLPHARVPQTSGIFLASQVPTSSSLNSTASGDSDTVPEQGRRISLSACLQVPPPPPPAPWGNYFTVPVHCVSRSWMVRHKCFSGRTCANACLGRQQGQVKRCAPWRRCLRVALLK